VINELFDRDVQLMVIKNTQLLSDYHNYKKGTGLINNDTVKEFTVHLSKENWESGLRSHNIL
jgi:hypothetical protein